MYVGGDQHHERRLALRDSCVLSRPSPVAEGATPAGSSTAFVGLKEDIALKSDDIALHVGGQARLLLFEATAKFSLWCGVSIIGTKPRGACLIGRS